MLSVMDTMMGLNPQGLDTSGARDEFGSDQTGADVGEMLFDAYQTGSTEIRYVEVRVPVNDEGPPGPITVTEFDISEPSLDCLLYTSPSPRD